MEQQHFKPSTSFPLISICVATYNGETYLREQLDSIFSQTYPNLEVIVCDDQSTDKTVDILEEYKQAKGLHYEVNKPNLGFVQNFAKLISLAKGEFIALSDQDDVWKENKIELLYQNIGDNALIHCDAELVDADGKLIHPSFSASSKKNIGQDLIEYVRFQNIVTGCTSMFRSNLKELLFPFPTTVPFHDEWIAIMAHRNGGVTYLDQALISYRQHSANIVGGLSIVKVEKFSKGVEVRRRFLQTVFDHREQIKFTPEELVWLKQRLSRINSLAFRSYTAMIDLKQILTREI